MSSRTYTGQFNSSNSGTTAQRPSEPMKFSEYFDTDLGKPIWFDGTDWVDATGATV